MCMTMNAIFWLERTPYLRQNYVFYYFDFCLSKTNIFNLQIIYEKADDVLLAKPIDWVLFLETIGTIGMYYNALLVVTV